MDEHRAWKVRDRAGLVFPTGVDTVEEDGMMHFGRPERRDPGHSAPA